MCVHRVVSHHWRRTHGFKVEGNALASCSRFATAGRAKDARALAALLALLLLPLSLASLLSFLGSLLLLLELLPHGLLPGFSLLAPLPLLPQLGSVGVLLALKPTGHLFVESELRLLLEALLLLLVSYPGALVGFL